MHAGSVAESLLLRIGFAPPVVVLFMPSRKQVDFRTGLRWIRAEIDRFSDEERDKVGDPLGVRVF